jgi:adenylate cyclase
MFGEMIPVGGGRPIPLLRSSLLIGRRENCDIVLQYSDISSSHCQLTLDGGYWFVRDLNSRNGIKVNGIRVTHKRLDPNDTLSISMQTYTVRYSPADNGALGAPPAESIGEVLSQPLLERAGFPSTSRPQAKSSGATAAEPARGAISAMAARLDAWFKKFE